MPDHGTGPGGQVVEGGRVAADECIPLPRPGGQIGGGGVADGSAVVPGVGFFQRPRGVEEEEVVLLAVVGKPEVPDPGVG